jgi:hypothetical protein
MKYHKQGMDPLTAIADPLLLPDRPPLKSGDTRHLKRGSQHGQKQDPKSPLHNLREDLLNS